MEVLDQLVLIFTQYGYLAVFVVLVACGFGVPVPEDIALIAGGVICGLSVNSAYPMSVNTMVIIAMVGVLLGDTIMFLLGRRLGPSITKVPGLKRLITPEIYAKIQEKVHRYGDKVLFVARFLPGLRAPIFVTAGISHKVPLWKFLLLDGSAALISVPVWVYLGYFFAYEIDDVIEKIREYEFVVLIGVLVLICGFIIYKTYRKKRIK